MNLEKEQNKPNASRKMKIIDIRAVIMKLKTKTIEKINETKCLLFGTINKIGKPLARLEREDTTYQY